MQSCFLRKKTTCGMYLTNFSYCFSVLMMSSIGFFISAFFYLFVKNVNDRNNKKCFIGYTLSMGFSYLSLILLQKVSNDSTTCGILGKYFDMLNSYKYTKCEFQNVILREWSDDRKMFIISQSFEK